MARPVLGGHNEVEISDEVKQAVEPVMNELKQRLGATEIVLNSATRQTVAGVNYNIVGTADGKMFTAKVFKALPHAGGESKLVEAELVPLMNCAPGAQ